MQANGVVAETHQPLGKPVGFRMAEVLRSHAEIHTVKALPHVRLVLECELPIPGCDHSPMTACGAPVEAHL